MVHFISCVCVILFLFLKQEVDATKANEVNVRKVGILGTGNFASAIAQRLALAGYDVTVASRRPEDRKLTLRSDVCLSSLQSAIHLTSVSECLERCHVVIVALHHEHFTGFFTPEVAQKAAGKILVDVSNRSTRGVQPSNAKLLSSLVPGAHVVKAFNTLSAYVLESETAGGSRMVCVAGDDAEARVVVCSLARDLGFECQESGGLESAWQLEESVLTVFPEWRVAAVIAGIVLAFWALFAITREHLVGTTSWSQFPVKTMNKVFGACALTELALTYLAGTCAAFLQIYNGTKHKRFPRWLDAWLKARKQLGLLAFGQAVVHAILSALLLSPTYVKSWYAPDALRVIVPVNQTGDIVVDLSKAWMTWNSELSLLVGVLAIVLMGMLAVTSLPSVTRIMNWAEWRFVQSGLGYVMLTLATSHLYAMSLHKWVRAGLPIILFRLSFMSIVLPTTVIALRIITLLPCVDNYIQRIRRGWERKTPSSSSDPAHGAENGSTSRTSAEVKSGASLGTGPTVVSNSETEARNSQTVGAETLV